MSVLKWDQNTERTYETGVDKGVLFPVDRTTGEYPEGFAWNGLVSVTKSPSGAESNKQYANNRVYLNLLSAEELSGTIEAFTWPDEFGECDGTAEVLPGVTIAQQSRRAFGLAYRSLIGNDTEGLDYGYKLHLVYNALAAPTESAATTVNESPEATTFSWEFSTTAVDVPGENPLTGKPYRPTATLVINSTRITAAKLKVIEDILWGTEGQDARLPLPAEVFEILEAGQQTVVTPSKPTSAGNVVTIPNVAGVEYRIDGVKRTGAVTITKNTIVTVVALPGYQLPADFDEDWQYTYTP